MSLLVQTNADKLIKQCLHNKQSFALIAGAGSGKTTSLISALKIVRSTFGNNLLLNNQRIACITYTNRAIGVIEERLDFDELFAVSTLHSFLWREVKHFNSDIQRIVVQKIIPKKIEKLEGKIGHKVNSQQAIRAKEQIEKLEADLKILENPDKFRYEDTEFSNFSEFSLGHDSVIEIAEHLLNECSVFRSILGSRYPFIFVDEAQDTFTKIIEGMNKLTSGDELPLVGYFGDPWQQIYKNRAGDFCPPDKGIKISKTENFRCSPEVVSILNNFRTDLKQVASGNIASQTGSAELVLIQSEKPESSRNAYSDDQKYRSMKKLNSLIACWGWQDDPQVKVLFLVRQMIAKHMGFNNLNSLFSGKYASMHAKNAFNTGDHYLIRPFVQVIIPLINAYRKTDHKKVLNLLIENSPGFKADGENSKVSLDKMTKLAQSALEDIIQAWEDNTIKDVLLKAHDHKLIKLSDELAQQINRKPQNDNYDETKHKMEKGNWLADKFFKMTTSELHEYWNFISEHTPFSTQHGVKGEEYPNVVVVYDDLEASWHYYNFEKLFSPLSSTKPKESQEERSRKLAYVSFSRAQLNLKVVFFTQNPSIVKDEIINRNLFSKEQIKISTL